MAKLVSTRRTPWVRGPTAVVDAMQLGAISTDNEVYFERVVAYTTFLNQGAHPIIDPIGEAIDAVLNSGTAIAATFSQDSGPSGLLTNYIDFTILVATTDEGGDITDTVTVSVQSIVEQGAAGIEVVVQNIANRLRAAAGV
jgi:hypothetical protein